MFMFSKKNIYLDYASTTPVDKKVVSEMKPYFSDMFYNPSSLYNEGREVMNVLEECRRKIAKYFSCKPDDITFTGSGTESDNLAILGVYEAYKDINPHFITSTIEHPAVLESFKEIDKRGGVVSYISPEEDGVISLNKISDSIKENTVLISIIHVNNEIGTIQPIKDISRKVNLWKKDNNRSISEYPFIHTDASQSPNYIKCNRESIGADLITLDGSKIYGPKGIGILYKNNKVKIKPISFGGGQENGLRPGTENVANIVGISKAIEIAEEMREEEVIRLGELQKYLIDKFLKEVKGASLNGSLKKRIVNNINICIPGSDSEFLIIALAQKGIMCSFMTACRNLSDDSDSYVISEIDPNCSKSSIRISMGRGTSKKDLDKVVGEINTFLDSRNI
jgi:cysteine desulfurase